VSTRQVELDQLHLSRRLGRMFLVDKIEDWSIGRLIERKKEEIARAEKALEEVCKFEYSDDQWLSHRPGKEPESFDSDIAVHALVCLHIGKRTNPLNDKRARVGIPTR